MESIFKVYCNYISICTHARAHTHTHTQFGLEHISLVIIGNKLDLVESRMVPQSSGERVRRLHSTTNCPLHCHLLSIIHRWPTSTTTPTLRQVQLLGRMWRRCVMLMAPVHLVPASILQNVPDYQFTTVNEVYYSSETYLNLELHTSIVAMALLLWQQRRQSYWYIRLPLAQFAFTWCGQLVPGIVVASFSGSPSLECEHWNRVGRKNLEFFFHVSKV